MSAKKKKSHPYFYITCEADMEAMFRELPRIAATRAKVKVVNIIIPTAGFGRILLDNLQAEFDRDKRLGDPAAFHVYLSVSEDGKEAKPEGESYE